MMAWFTEEVDFFKGHSPEKIIEEFGSPLYVYNEDILRKRCREMRNLLSYPDFAPSYSVKANSNLELLKIIKSEGLLADAMSPGEIFVLEMAGFKPEEIFYISNNVSAEEMRYAIDRGILISLDSLSQLELFGRLNPGGSLALRFNPGLGAGHSKKVITGGRETKFGINAHLIDEVKMLLDKYQLKLVGINQHIGSLFMDGKPYLEGVKSALEIAENFPDLSFVDFGGGFGIPYRKQEGEERLDLLSLGREIDKLIAGWQSRNKAEITFKTEPGRYVVAESGLLMGRVTAIKENYDRKYIGTDIGFNVLARPMVYGSHHDIEIYRQGELVKEGSKEEVFVTGNICESGDLLAEERNLVRIEEDDLLLLTDAGAYGYSMSSNYNNRLRPAEVLIDSQGKLKLIRRRDQLEDLVRGFVKDDR